MAFITRNPVFKGSEWQVNTGQTTGQTTVQIQPVPPIPAGAMTLNGTIMRAGMLFAVLLLAAAGGWAFLRPHDSSTAVILVVAAILALVTGIWGQVSKKIRPPVMFAYAAFEGALLGVISRGWEAEYDGIVGQAVLATLITTGVVLAGYRSGILRASSRLARTLLLAMIGYMGFLAVSLVISMLDHGSLWDSPLGLLVAAIGVLMAAGFLVQDFAAIENGVANGIAERNEWRAAFGLMITLIWMYLQMLRILGAVRR